MTEYLHVEPGQWVVAKMDWARSYQAFRADKVTAEQVRTRDQIMTKYYRITRREQIVAVCPDKETADHLIQRLDGCRGEYRRREQAAAVAYDQQIARIIRDAQEGKA